MCSLKNTYKHIPKSQTAHFSPVHACGVRPDGCARTCRTRFTNSFRGFRERSPRHTPCCCPAARKKEHCRMHAGAHARRDGPTCTYVCARAQRRARIARISSARSKGILPRRGSTVVNPVSLKRRRHVPCDGARYRPAITVPSSVAGQHVCPRCPAACKTRPFRVCAAGRLDGGDWLRDAWRAAAAAPHPLPYACTAPISCALADMPLRNAHNARSRPAIEPSTTHGWNAPRPGAFKEVESKRSRWFHGTKNSIFEALRFCG
jgi:hypothetical protein